MKITIYSYDEGYSPKDSEWSLGTLGDYVFLGQQFVSSGLFSFFLLNILIVNGGRQLLRINWKDL